MTFSQEIPLLSTHLFGTTKVVDYSAKDYQVGFLEHLSAWERLIKAMSR